MNKKIIINPKETKIYKAVEINFFYSNFLFKILFFSLWVFGIASIVLVILDNAVQSNIFGINSANIGFAYIVLSLFLIYLPDRAFYFSKLRHPETVSLKKISEDLKKDEEINIFSVFSFELARATARIFCDQKRRVTTKELIYCLLFSSEIDFILLRLGISKKSLSKSLESYSGEDKISEILEYSLKVALAEGHHQIEVGDTFVALCEFDSFLKKFVIDLGLETNDVANVVYWQTNIFKKLEVRKGILNPEIFRLTGGMGRDWAFGWTPFLKQFATDLSREVQDRGLNMEIVGHDSEINQISEALLMQSSGNAIVVGEPGVGKKTTILGFVKKVLSGETKSSLDFQHVYKIDLDYLLSGLNSSGEVTERIAGVLNEAAAAGNIILYFENIQNLLSSGDAGKVNATEVLLPFLEYPNIHIIATCDILSFNRYIRAKTALNQKFTRVNVMEPDKKELIRILEDIVPTIEYQTGTLVTYEAIKETIHSADKYIQNLPDPEKSISLLDGAVSRVSSRDKNSLILAKDILDYVEEKYDIPAGEVDTKEKKRLLDLEKILHESIIGQNEAINAIANAMRRARAGVEDNKKPIGTFLFMGPTGVGKTATAKTLANAYFGSEERMIRFDMSEFQSEADIYRLIGSQSDGEETQGLLTTAVREHPFSLILFDEIEKAHSKVLDLFLQMLDEGFVTDGAGHKVSFSNSIIIATSNAGANLIMQSIESGIEYERTKKALLEYVFNNNIFRPEFINRFTAVIAFSPLSRSDILQIANLLIGEFKKTILSNRGIAVNFESATIELLANLGYDPKMGARPMERVIQEKVENLLAKKILAEEIKKGESITITQADISSS